jgi:phosphoribosylamine-glycine ligase
MYRCGYSGYVVKASGLAAGKGVIVTHDINQAENAIIDMIDRHSFGNAGDTVLVEELIYGQEVSVCILFLNAMFLLMLMDKSIDPKLSKMIF